LGEEGLGYYPLERGLALPNPRGGLVFPARTEKISKFRPKSGGAGSGGPSGAGLVGLEKRVRERGPTGKKKKLNLKKKTN